MSTKESLKNGKSPETAPMVHLVIGGATYTTRLTNKFKNRENWIRPDNRLVKAVIPGTIQRIMVSEGDQVEAGTPMLILEAMKMRNEVLSPITGVIKGIYATEGEQVPKEFLLVEFM